MKHCTKTTTCRVSSTWLLTTMSTIERIVDLVKKQDGDQVVNPAGQWPGSWRKMSPRQVNSIPFNRGQNQPKRKSSRILILTFVIWVESNVVVFSRLTVVFDRWNGSQDQIRTSGSRFTGSCNEDSWWDLVKWGVVTKWRHIIWTISDPTPDCLVLRLSPQCSCSFGRDVI